MTLTPHAMITIDGSVLGAAPGKTYEQSVEGTLKTIRLNRVGQALVGNLSRKLKIRPWLPANPAAKPNAFASPTHHRKAIATNQGLYNCSDASPINDPVTGAHMKGQGGGSDSVIQFNPSNWMTQGVADARGKSIAAGKREDEILFHEMVHSLRQMIGQMNCSMAAPGYDTKEEVWSIMTTNIYCSAWNRPLRLDHHGFKTMTVDEARTYYANFTVMIGHMCRDLPMFTKTVASIDYIQFNPFRQFYKDNPSA